MSRPESGTKLEEWDVLVTMIKRKFRSRPDYLAMAARVEDEYIFPMRDASTNKRNVARDLKKLEKEALMGQYYRYVSQEPEAVLQLAKEAVSSYNRYIPTKSDDYFKVKKEVAIQRKIAGYYEKGGNEKKAASLRKDAEKREKNSKKGIREEG